MSLLQKIFKMAYSSESHFKVYFVPSAIGISFAILIGMYSIIIEFKDSNTLISFAMANLTSVYIVQIKFFVVQVSLLYKLKCSIFPLI